MPWGYIIFYFLLHSYALGKMINCRQEQRRGPGLEKLLSYIARPEFLRVSSPRNAATFLGVSLTLRLSQK